MPEPRGDVDFGPYEGTEKSSESINKEEIQVSEANVLKSEHLCAKQRQHS